MVDKELVEKISEAFLKDGDVFLVAVKVSTQNSIRVFLDGGNGVTIDDCIRLSRHIEAQLDRDKEDFELEVSSVGVGHPLQLKRQYNINVGRRLAINLNDDRQVKGKLLEVKEEGVVIEIDKEKKGKKKPKTAETDPESSIFIGFEQIVDAKVQVSFNK